MNVSGDQIYSDTPMNLYEHVLRLATEIGLNRLANGPQYFTEFHAFAAKYLPEAEQAALEFLDAVALRKGFRDGHALTQFYYREPTPKRRIALALYFLANECLNERRLRQ